MIKQNKLTFVCADEGICSFVCLFVAVLFFARHREPPKRRSVSAKSLIAFLLEPLLHQ